MRLNLKDIIHVPGAVRPFVFQLDLSDLEFSGIRPIDRPISVTGQVRNMAGALVLEGTAATTLHLVCDLCAKPFAREKTVRLETLLAQELADELRGIWNVDYDDAGAVGRRYRRQDEIGTPFCITYDFDSIEDHAVTIRERDTMEQVRIPLDKVKSYLIERLGC